MITTNGKVAVITQIPQWIRVDTAEISKTVDVLS